MEPLAKFVTGLLIAVVLNIALSFSHAFADRWFSHKTSRETRLWLHIIFTLLAIILPLVIL